MISLKSSTPMEIFFNFSCLFIDRSSFLSPRIHTFPVPPETSQRFRAAQLSPLSIVYWNLTKETSKKQKTADLAPGYHAQGSREARLPCAG